jgi:hypothetical protein
MIITKTDKDMEGLNVRRLKVANSGVNTQALIQRTTTYLYFIRQKQDCNVADHLPAVGVSKLQPYSVIGRTIVERNGFETFAAQQGAIPARPSEMREMGNTWSQATVPCPGFQAEPFHIHVSCVTDTPSAGSDYIVILKSAPSQPDSCDPST